MKLAFRFVLTIGIVNLFADLTYEGGRSITGPFLGSLGASAAMVGLVAGLGELMGYGLRSISGYVADKTQKYWVVIFTGYLINMLAVPALALAGSWPVAAALIVLERTGRAIRRPAVEALISHAGKSIGQGWVFGLNEALDQTGATIGPLIAALVLYLRRDYRQAFALLLVSALLCLGTLAAARVLYPRPHELEGSTDRPGSEAGFSRPYWLYVLAGALVAVGFSDFALIAFHFRKTGAVTESGIPVFYSVAMATAALASFVFGRLFDKAGFPVLLLGFFLSAFAAPCAFRAGFAFALTGMVLWGIGIGVQDSLLKAVLVGVAPPGKRSTAFGVFDTGFGLAWFVGSAGMGWLYQISIPALIVFSAGFQLAALPVFLLARRPMRESVSRG